MPKIVNKKETISFQGFTVSDFLKEDFFEKIKKLGKEAKAINIVFIIKEESKDGKKGGIHPVILGHHDSEEIKEKILNIDAPPEICEKITKILEEME